MPQVCFDKKILIGTIIIVIILFTYQYYCLFVKYKKLKMKKNKDDKIIDEKFAPINVLQGPPNMVPMPPIPPISSMIDIVKDYDYKKIYDPLEDPTKRPDRYVMGPLYGRRYFDYPTRGYPDNFRWFGLLISTDGTHDKPNKILRLFGRPKYPNSTTDYDYYTMINTGYDQIKVNLEQRKELYDDDTVYVKELGKTYRVQMNKNDDLQYTPF